jgi:hypothetical protein
MHGSRSKISSKNIVHLYIYMYIYIYIYDISRLRVNGALCHVHSGCYVVNIHCSLCERRAVELNS